MFNKLTPCLLPLVYTRCNWLTYASCIGHLSKPLASDTCLSHLLLATCLSQLYICHLHTTPACATCTSNLLLATCTTLTPQYKYHYTGQLVNLSRLLITYIKQRFSCFYYSFNVFNYDNSYYYHKCMWLFHI